MGTFLPRVVLIAAFSALLIGCSSTATLTAVPTKVSPPGTSTITGNGFSTWGKTSVNFTEAGGCGSVLPTSAALPVNAGGPVSTIFTPAAGLTYVCTSTITAENKKVVFAGDSVSTSVIVTQNPIILPLPAGAAALGSSAAAAAYSGPAALTGVEIAPTVTIKPSFVGRYVITAESGYPIRLITVKVAVKSDITAVTSTAMSPSPATGVTSVDIAEPPNTWTETITIKADSATSAANARFDILLTTSAKLPAVVFFGVPGPK